jgi:hypothetical protein
MGFAQSTVDELLAKTGRMCAVCNRLYGVQVHHIVPRHEGGSDEPENAIPLCPNCHDEVHASYAPGRTTRLFSTAEVRAHLARTIELASTVTVADGDARRIEDVRLVSIYAQALNRPAFRTHFHLELSFSDLDKALEDAVTTINTGLWRMRDGTEIDRAFGVRRVTNPSWKAKLDDVVMSIGLARRALREAFGLDEMFMARERFGHDWLDARSRHLRSDDFLGASMDEHRQAAIDAMNAVLEDAGLDLLPRVGTYG